jgi:hypothetical protein
MRYPLSAIAIVALLGGCGADPSGTTIPAGDEDSGASRPIPGDESDSAGTGGDAGASDAGTEGDATSNTDGDDSGTTGDAGGNGDASTLGDSNSGPADTGAGDAVTGDTGPADGSGVDDGGADGVSTDASIDDDTSGLADVNLDRDAGLCATASANAENATLPVDIIWVVDSSPSMDRSIDLVEANLNAFTARIAASGLSYHVVMVGADRDYSFDAQDFTEVCVPPPLSAAAGCPDTDSSTYLHVRRGVHSSDSFDKAMDFYPEYRSFLRPGAIAHFVFVTDDDAGFGPGADEFLSFLDTATAPGFDRVHVHSIVDLLDSSLGCGFDDTCSCGEERGDEYIAASEATDGTIHSICADDWDPIFDALEETVVEGTTLPCAFALPDVGEELIVDRINVLLFDDADVETLVPAVDTAADCDGSSGWYYDNPAAPTAVSLCPAACVGLSGRVEIEFGCATVKD